jgi:TldD protein
MKILRAFTAVIFCAAIFLCVAHLRASTPATGTTNNAPINASGTDKATPHPDAGGDPLLDALLTELDRSKAQLKIDRVQSPYYIEYRVNDVDDYDAEAAFGAIRESQRVHLRILRVVVRVGDYKQDSYFGSGMGETNILPLDNDPIALRHQIWLTTDEAYKAAGEALADKQAELKRFSTDPNPVDDFSKETVVKSVEPTVSLKLDQAAWEKTLAEMTNLYRQYPDVQSVSASARFSAINEYFVDSEGTVTRNGKTTYNLQLNSSAQADDGMRLSRNPYWMVGRAEELPTREKLLADTKQALDTIVVLRKAPIVEEEYRGPVLFAPDAADDVLASLVGTSVLGRKPQLGRPNRTVGAFATSYKSRVLPTFLSIIDDPTLKDFEGHSLVGSYDVDSEGVKAQTVSVIQNGTLSNYLLGRQPVRDFPASNGHGRAAPGSLPTPNLGVLLLKSAEAQSPDELHKKILQMIKDSGNPYAYRVDTLGPGNSPRLLYRVYADGHEQLVRGAVFNELDTRALRSNLIAVGNDPLVSNRAGGVPTTIICPSLLFDELEVKRADTSKDKLPDYPAPPLQ